MRIVVLVVLATLWPAGVARADGDRLDGVGLANCTGSDFAHAPAPHLAFLDQFGDGSRYIFNGNPGIKAVLVE